MCKFRMIKGNLFSAPLDSTLVHCISKDCAMGKGIAKTFKTYYPRMKDFLLNSKGLRNGVDYPAIFYYSPYKNKHNVINLITKEKYYNKPTYDSLKQSLINLRELCKSKGIKDISMPLIGCGLDNLDWVQVKSILLNVFNSDDININVYIL